MSPDSTGSLVDLAACLTWRPGRAGSAPPGRVRHLTSAASGWVVRPAAWLNGQVGSTDSLANPAVESISNQGPSGCQIHPETWVAARIDVGEGWRIFFLCFSGSRSQVFFFHVHRAAWSIGPCRLNMRCVSLRP